MSSVPQRFAPGDPVLVKEIVTKLKRQGLFDEFRKQCLADVDTKPAYQNLRQRVEGYVDRYLSGVPWNKDSNKNQIREQLRKKIEKAPMLSSGIDIIVEQVVNPKMEKDFKPEIERMVCEFLGIDPKEREMKQKRIKEALAAKRRLERQQQQHEMMMQDGSYQQFQHEPGSYDNHPAHGYPPSLLDIHQQSYNYENQPGIPNYNAYPPSLMEMNQNTYNVNNPPPTSYPPPPIPGYQPPAQQPQPQPQPQNFINQAIQNYAFGIQQGMTSTAPATSQYSDITSNIALSLEHQLTNVVTSGNRPMTLHQMLYPQPQVEVTMETVQEEIVKEEPLEKKEKKKKIEPLTVEDLLNIPLPKAEPKKRDRKRVKDGNKASVSPIDVDMDENSKTSDSVVIEGYTTVDMGDSNMVVEEGQVMVETTVETLDEAHLQGMQVNMADGTQQVIQVVEEGGTEKKFHFAWNDMESDNASDVTISSVHTSDLSNFEDDYETSAFEESDTEMKEESMEIKEKEEQVMEGVVSSEVAVEQIETTQEKTKPRRLIALTYNYSDSEDDETREERKARIAKEKEDRYLRRQQRRAELEAKRKEKDAEKARLLAEKQKLKEQKQEELEATEPDSTQDNESKEIATTESSQESEAKRDPSVSPRKRPTKQELKEKLREQKVEEKRRSMRRTRMRNRKYLSDEFTSIFTENKQLLSGNSYGDEIVMVDVSGSQTELVQSPPTPTQDEQVEYSGGEVMVETGIPIVEVQSAVPIHRTRSRTRQTESESDRPSTPGGDVTDLVGSTRGLRKPAEDILCDSRSTDGSTSHEFIRSRSSETQPRFDEDLSGMSDEGHRMRNQRYDESDLYKPRPTICQRKRLPSPDYAHSMPGKKRPREESPETGKHQSSTAPDDAVLSTKRRRPSSPEYMSGSRPGRRNRGTPSEEYPSGQSDSEHHRSRGLTPPMPSSYSSQLSPVSSHESTPGLSDINSSDESLRSRSRSRSRSVYTISPSRSSRSRSRSSRSRSRSSHSSRSRSSDSRSRSRSSHSRSRSPYSDEAKRLLDEDEEERERERRKRKPIEQVNFGEAAKRTRAPLASVNFGEAARRAGMVSRGRGRPPVRGMRGGMMRGMGREFMQPPPGYMPGPPPGADFMAGPPPPIGREYMMGPPEGGRRRSPSPPYNWSPSKRPPSPGPGYRRPPSPTRDFSEAPPGFHSGSPDFMLRRRRPVSPDPHSPMLHRTQSLTRSRHSPPPIDHERYSPPHGHRSPSSDSDPYNNRSPRDRRSRSSSYSPHRERRSRSYSPQPRGRRSRSYSPSARDRGSPTYTPPPRERRSPTLSPIDSESDHSPEPEARRPPMRPRSPPPVQRKVRPSSPLEPGEVSDAEDDEESPEMSHRGRPQAMREGSSSPSMQTKRPRPQMPASLPEEFPIHQTRSATAKAAEPNIMTRASRKKSIEDARGSRRSKYSSTN